jgi:D-glycero-alpha-D-manno-heptose 1-phosphate guanylyltransferase
MIKEAILLAGGLGTRLRSAVPELPKCLAPVRGRPFIAYVTDYFRQQGIERFIFALGYKSDYFDDFFRTEFPDGGYTVSLEDAPLGTGGAIRQACGLSVEKTVLILNGDTFFRIGLKALSDFHEEKRADCSLCLRPMENFDRFGVVELDDEAGNEVPGETILSDRADQWRGLCAGQSHFYGRGMAAGIFL